MKLKKRKFLITLVSIISAYFLICFLLFFFEPADYSAPDLNEFKSYFEMYEKYEVAKNENFYIKQIDVNDIATADCDDRLKYVKNTILAIAYPQYTFDDVTSLLNSYNCEICGYIADVNFYQIEFNSDCNFEELMALCNDLVSFGIFKTAIPDYFEETPVSEYSTEELNYSSNQYYYEMLELEKAWNLFEAKQTVNVGIIDFFVDNENEYLNIANTSEYSNNDIYNSSYGNSVSHGTHVAGIIGASHNSESPGVINNAKIYSYNGINVSTSYWIANICDMIINNNVKAINISMAYNSYINMSAAFGCENAINHITGERTFFSELLSNIIDNGYEFVICAAAGNDGNASAYKVFGSYFSYGDKKILNTLDIFSIFDSKPDYVDAQYSFMFSSPTVEAVADRIIIVGSIDSDYKYSDFSNSISIDIAAPGEHIYSTSIDSTYNYMSGTSMATPFVTGTAAMIFSVNPDLSGAQVKNIILDSSKISVSDGEYTYPILNIYEAIKSAVEIN